MKQAPDRSAERRTPAAASPQSELPAIEQPDQGQAEYIPVPGRSPLPPRRRKGRRPSRRRKRGEAPRKPALSIERILQWADEHRQRTGKWPNGKSGRVAAAPRENWSAIDAALRVGVRSLAGGSTLCRLLAEHRDSPYRKRPGPVTEEQILTWADAHRERTGEWPSRKSGPVQEAPEENWAALDTALCSGKRGLPGDSSLAKLLRRRRGRRHGQMLPPFTERQILEWADAHYAALGVWPGISSGSIPGADGETWQRVEVALSLGARGLPGGSSLAKLLQEARGKRNRKRLPPLDDQQILAWATAHKRRTGKWPTARSGEIVGAPGETWAAVHQALSSGIRGHPGGTTLVKLLQTHLGIRNPRRPPPLTEAQILEWAAAHRARTGRWPSSASGEIAEAPGENWNVVDGAMRRGLRGLPGGSTLTRFLQEQSRPESAEG